MKITRDINISRKYIDEDLAKVVFNPVQITVNGFNEEDLVNFEEKFYEALDAPQPVIPVFINTFGGSVYEAFAMMDIIKGSHKTVATIILGKAMSAGCLLGSSGTEGYRYSNAHSSLMIHEISCMTDGKSAEIVASAKETDRYNKRFLKAISQNCGHEADYFQKLVAKNKNADLYLDPLQAKRHNLINHIKLPEFRITLTEEIEFIL